MPRFTVSRPDREQIVKIVDRAAVMAAKHREPLDRLEVMMDLTATHNEVPLKLEELAQADDFNFAHDVFGISRHIDRRTGRLTRGFLPRYART